MAHALTNLKSHQALEQKLLIALNNAEFAWDSLVTWSGTFDAFCTEAAKSLSEWMTQSDLIGVVHNVTYRLLALEEAEVLEHAKLADYADTGTIQKIASAIMAELCSLPRNYEVDFPMPNIRPSAIINLSSRSTIHPAIGSKDSGNFFSANPLAASYLRIKSSGYARISRQESAIRDATSALRVIFYLGQIIGLFTRRRFSMRSLATRGILGTRTETVHSAHVSTGSGVARIELTLAMSQYLSEVSVAVDQSGAEAAIERLRSLLELLYQPDAEENVQSIRRAIEWGFDAEIEEDETTRFIKTCIGLEAVLTDQIEGVGITEQLADRCAFLLSKTTGERERIRKKIREIYRLRSKIVHGTVAGLSPHDALLARDASIYLSTVVRLELNGVLDWWEKRSSRIARL